ncbi:MAG: response regulator [Acidobacteriota bacterium]|nr:response regulator [Acidobacteriota bacterium]
MTIDDALKLLDVAVNLLSVVVWPIVLVFALVHFGSAIREFIASIGEFSLKAAGLDVSAKRKQSEAAAALGAAIKERTPSDATTSDARAVAAIATPQMIRRAEKATVLWVDDRPRNNSHERQALEALGITFVLATSTDDALKELSRRFFNVVISDMGRPPDAQAGYTLLDKVRAEGNQTPFIIYAGSREPEHVAESLRRGADGCTNRPDELFEMVLSAL